MKYVRVLTLVVFTLNAFGRTHEELKTAANVWGKVKGQNYFTTTMMAKVVGAEGLSGDLMKNLENDNFLLPENASLVVGASGTNIPLLVTETVKISTTKISIPLSNTFLDKEWYRDTLKKFLIQNKIALENTEKRFSENGTSVKVIQLKLLSAATLRDHILTVFGNLIHSPVHLPEDLHYSLLQLIDLLRLRRIPIIQIFENLNKMMFQTPHDQFLMLFDQLESAVPKHFRSVVTFWLEALHRKQINVDEIFKNRTEINIFANTDMFALNDLSQPLLFSESTIKKSPKENEKVIGKILSYIITDISDRRIILTSQLFAGILAHMPLNELSAEAEEYNRFVIEYLKQGQGTAFQMAIASVTLENITNPFDLVREVLMSLMATNYLVKPLESILLHTEPKLIPDKSLNYQIMHSILTSEQFQNLFGMIVPGEYPPEAVHATDKIVQFINEDTATFEEVLKRFVKHTYETPTDLLLALLTRISVRVNKLDITTAAEILKSSIIFKNAMNNLRMALTVKDIINLLSFIQISSTSPQVRKTASYLKILLQTEKEVIQQGIIGKRIQDCSSPQNCIVITLKTLLSAVKNVNILEKIREILFLIEPNSGSNAIQTRFLMDEGQNCPFCKDFNVDTVSISSESDETFSILSKETN